MKRHNKPYKHFTFVLYVFLHLASTTVVFWALKQFIQAAPNKLVLYKACTVNLDCRETVGYSEQERSDSTGK